MILTFIAIFFLGGYFFGRRDSNAELQYLRQQLAQRGSVTQTPVVVLQSPETTIQPLPPPVHRQVDNALTLLYLGAFLFLSSVGLFMAIAGLPGAAKSFIIILLVGLFYGGGLLLYDSKRLRPAGMAFMAIGMILMPFFGLSLYAYVFRQSHGPIVWSVVSLMTLLLYYHAWSLTRQVLMTYLMLGAVLSLFESSVSLIGLPAYYFAYVMTATAMVLQFLYRKRSLPIEQGEPLLTTSTLFVPLSIVLSLTMVTTHGLPQFGAALLLAAGYYLVQAQSAKNRLRHQLLLLSDSLASVAVLVLVYALTHSADAVALGAIGLSLSHLIALTTYWWKHQTMAVSGTFLSIPAAVLSLIASLAAVNNAALLTISVAFAAIVSTGLWLVTNRAEHLVATAAEVLLLPLIAGLYWADPNWSPQVLEMTYILTAATLALCYKLLIRSPDAKLIAKVTTYASVAIVGYIGLSLGGWWAPGTIGLISLALFALGTGESSDERLLLFDVSLLAQLTTVVLTIVQAVQHDQLAVGIPAGLVILSLIYAGIAVSGLLEAIRRQHVRYAAITSALLGAGAVCVFAQTNLLMIVSLALAAVLIYQEASLQRNVVGKEFAYGTGMAAFQWLIYLAGVHEFQVYSHLWALLFAGLAYNRNLLKDFTNENSYTMTALLVVTVPLAIQALSGDMVYGWLLIVEQLAVVLLGMALRRPFVRRWGVWVSVSAVLYQLRSLTFIALGFLAVVLIVIAIRVLQKGEHSNSP